MATIGKEFMVKDLRAPSNIDRSYCFHLGGWILAIAQARVDHYQLDLFHLQRRKITLNSL